MLRIELPENGIMDLPICHASKLWYFKASTAQSVSKQTAYHDGEAVSSNISYLQSTTVKRYQ